MTEKIFDVFWEGPFMWEEPRNGLISITPRVIA